MRFHPDFLSPSSLPRAIFTGATALAILVACSDSTAPSAVSELDPSASIEVIVADAVKLAYMAEMARAYHGASAGNFMMAPLTMAPSIHAPSVAGASMSSALKPYSKSNVPFAPEAAPANAVPNLKDDGLFPDIPIGFAFEFYGNVYSQINLYFNGFITLGSNIPVDGAGKPLGFWTAGNIPFAGTPNNMIAMAWNDWRPNLVPGSIRYETRGTEPNRRFILQFTNVPEYGGSGRLTSQLVLAEGSNKVTINTMSMSITNFGNRVTQGIEDAGGSQAVFDSVQNQVSKAWSPRVRGYFNLANDAVVFSPPAPNKAPVVSAPANVFANTALASCAANVDVGVAGFSDDAPGASVMGVRGDGLALHAAYPKGVTTIAWISTDVEEAKTTVNQTVTVSDKENPSVSAPASISADNDPGMGSAAIAAGAAVAADNCPDVSVSGARSDGAALSAAYPVGKTTITWTASDESGNSAAAVQSVVVRDVEAPSLSLENIELDATMRFGAVVSFASLASLASDNVGVASVLCSRESGSVFPVGSTSVTCVALDAAGNRASGSFVVTVHGAGDQIVALIGFIERLELHNGDANPMLNQLRHALSDVENANGASCKKMSDILKMLTGKKGSEISAPEYAEMIADAKRIMNVLGCQ